LGHLHPTLPLLSTTLPSFALGFTAEQLANMLWALATLNYIPGTPLLETAANTLLANLALCAPRQAAQVCVGGGGVKWWCSVFVVVPNAAGGGVWGGWQQLLQQLTLLANLALCAARQAAQVCVGGGSWRV
jgi:hypothetical protein